jgi:RecA-family ATPase
MNSFMTLILDNPFNEVETDSTPLPFIDISGWDSEPTPDRDWAVLDRIPLRQTNLFSGEGGSGKSSVSLHLCCAHVLGRDWLGLLPEGTGDLYRCRR